jgi:hypothetical protein
MNYLEPSAQLGSLLYSHIGLVALVDSKASVISRLHTKSYPVTRREGPVRRRNSHIL